MEAGAGPWRRVPWTATPPARLPDAALPPRWPPSDPGRRTRPEEQRRQSKRERAATPKGDAGLDLRPPALHGRCVRFRTPSAVSPREIPLSLMGLARSASCSVGAAGRRVGSRAGPPHESLHRNIRVALAPPVASDGADFGPCITPGVNVTSPGPKAHRMRKVGRKRSSRLRRLRAAQRQLHLIWTLCGDRQETGAGDKPANVVCW